MDFSSLTLDRSISYIRGVMLIYIITMFVEISEPNANIIDPDSAASYLDLQCLPMSFLWDARLKWVHHENMPK